MQIIVIGFLGAIFLGGVILYLPISNQEPIGFLHALFTSTSAICVTGLVTIIPATQFTVFGKVVLLFLIQIGGLGVIAVGTSFFLMLKRKISLNYRILMFESFNTDGPGGVVKLVRSAIIGTFFVEGIGAFIYAFAFIPKYGVLRGLCYSVFQAVSSFCNAGIDILGTDSMAGFAYSPLVNINTMLLIIVGGIGFTVWLDLRTNGKRILNHEVPNRWWFTRLQLHSKLAIVTTLILIVTGTLLVLLFEYDNDATIGTMSFGNKLMASAFQSVTTRTAGYSTISQLDLHSETKLLSIILMIIGGSPVGTAGGIKTTTFAMLVITAISFIRGGNDTEFFGRKISKENFRTGFTIVMLALAIYLSGTMAITVIENDTIPVINIMFETASALGTVGLTANLTADLSSASQIILMIMMYLGRIGPLTFALVFGKRMHTKDKLRELPERRIIIG